MTSKRHVMMRLVLASALALELGGCVLNSTYAQAMDRWTEKHNTLQGELEQLRAERDQLAQEKASLQELLADRESTLSKTSADLEDLDRKVSDQKAQLASTRTQLEEVSDQAAAADEKAKALEAQRAALLAEREALAEEVKQLKQLRKAAEARNREYKDLLGKLKKMIDAGSLEVKIRNGLMLVTMPSDVLFATGEATLKPEAVDSVKQLASTLKTFKNRRFQVVGHSDSVPISTPEFPSNWDLSAKRAIEVVRVLISAGVPPKMLSAAGAAEYDPVGSNSNASSRAKNRRVELVFVPKIDELPGGFGE